MGGGDLNKLDDLTFDRWRLWYINFLGNLTPSPLHLKSTGHTYTPFYTSKNSLMARDKVISVLFVRHKSNPMDRLSPNGMQEAHLAPSCQAVMTPLPRIYVSLTPTIPYFPFPLM